MPGMVTVGRFDGRHPSLACATTKDNVVVHSPHSTTDDGIHEQRQLSVNHKISALTSGNLALSRLEELNHPPNRDMLFVGQTASLLAYDVEKNADIFFKDISDGVNDIVVGPIPGVKNDVAIVGGNCSIQGFTYEGEESFWTVTGDNVTCLALRAAADNTNQLLVGSEDYQIRIFSQEEVIHEVTESDVLRCLAPMAGAHYGYALDNGTCGVYNNAMRLWQNKSKEKAVSMCSFDLNNDGVPELVTGWNGGHFDVRNQETGELVYKDEFGSDIAKVLATDFRGDGTLQLVACSVDGELRGYVPPEAAVDGGVGVFQSRAADVSLLKLQEQKQMMLAELAVFEANTKTIASGQTSGATIPVDTALGCTVSHAPEQKCVRLSLFTNNDTLIKCAMIFAEVLFEGESYTIFAEHPSNLMDVPLQPQKNVECQVLLKIVVGHRSTVQDHVFEVQYTLPRFALFKLATSTADLEMPTSSVTFRFSERINRVALWMNQAFNLDKNVEIAGLAACMTQEQLDTTFVNVFNQCVVRIKANVKTGQMTILCDDMDVAGDVIQDLCNYLKIEDLDSVADFPAELDTFRQTVQNVEEHNAIRLKLSAEIADGSNTIKTLIIRAEDARLLDDMKAMRQMYGQLFDFNRELIGEYTKRNNNHAELLRCLKLVNAMIQKSARLRNGKPKSNLIAVARKAIKDNNMPSLFKIITRGAEGMTGSESSAAAARDS